MKLSIVIPVYNEKATLPLLLEKVKAVKIEMEKEIILVDDGSTDGTREILKSLKGVKIILHKKNMGKGAAIKSGIEKSTGDIIIVQDADLEYEPQDYPALLEPFLKKGAQVVYGSRILNKSNGKGGFFAYLGGRAVTIETNILFLSHITDEPTCYKVFSSKLIKSIKIKENRFAWEPEVTAKILKRGIKIHEVPIKYYHRDFEHGKKINWKDGFSALWALLKYRFVD